MLAEVASHALYIGFGRIPARMPGVRYRVVEGTITQQVCQDADSPLVWFSPPRTHTPFMLWSPPAQGIALAISSLSHLEQSGVQRLPSRGLDPR